MSGKIKIDGPLTFGFDIGIASVGWCVLGEKYIVDLGVRRFDKAETAKEGESLNLARRTARLMRRRLRRRTRRLAELARLLRDEGLIGSVKVLRKPPISRKMLGEEDRHRVETAWELRVRGLDEKLTPEEWARVLYHLCKHRGFHWVSRAEEKKAEEDKGGEGGKVKQGLSGTKRLMDEKHYRSAAEMALKEFPDAQRNKRGDYSKALSRVLLAKELRLLFEKQRKYGNPHATFDLEMKIAGNGDKKSGLFWEQKPPLSGNDLLKMLGRCTFERPSLGRSGGSDGKGEYRAPKASFTAERHVWLTRLNNNLRITVDGRLRALNAEEREIALPLPYNRYANGELSYKQLRAALAEKPGLKEFSFSGIAPDKENGKLVKLSAWGEISKKLKEKFLKTEWESIAGAAMEGNPERLDDIAWVLSVYKDDAEVERELRKLNLPGGEKMIKALSEISFDKFHNLSLKALRKIVPHMEAGLRYDEACEKAGYHHSQLFKLGEGKEKYLPPFYSGREKDGRMVFDDEKDIPRNPVVLRSLNQARKVMNALIRRYGSPASVHIEMARDLSKPKKERNAISDEQGKYQKRKEADKNLFVEIFHREPKKNELEKFQLYQEQHAKSVYPSAGDKQLAVIDIDRLLEDGYVQVDHILPFRRSFDNSKNNKVLVLTKENQDKGNRTPYEYLGGAYDSPRWKLFEAFVKGNHYRPAKESRLLRKNFGDEEASGFRDRNLNDTRYICRFFKNYVENSLKFSSDSKRCVVVNGGLTSLLRARWGFPTSKEKREESDRHHAMDAAIVAACGNLIVRRISTKLNTDEWAHRPDEGGYVNLETGEILSTKEFVRRDDVYKLLPRPWRHFSDELKIRLNTDDPESLKNEVEHFDYPPEVLENIRPLFVSCAPQRRNGGAAHKETIYAQPERLKAEGSVVQKVSLSSLTLANMENLVDPHRNEKLYAAIRARLEAHNGKGDKAFPADNPLRKPDRNGNPTGPVVRTVKMLIDKLSGIPIRGGVAKNDTMLRVDVFRHKQDRKYHLVPVYVHHAVARELPNRAIVQGKDENDWTLIDEEHFEFCFSLYPNDLVKISLKKETHLGYYAGCDRANAGMSLWSHDRNKATGKEGLIRGIGVKTALLVEKFHVDTLGNLYPAPPEKRRGLA